MRSTFARLGVLSCAAMGLLVPAGAEATSPPHLAVPEAPINVTAVKVCGDVITAGGVACSLSVRWSAGPHDGGSPVTGYTVAGDISGEVTTIRVTGDPISTYWVSLGGSTSDAAYTVTATNAVGSSLPAETSVEIRGLLPPRVPELSVRAKNNGARNDVLSFLIRGDQGSKVAIKVNGKTHTLRPRNGRAELTIRDTNRRAPTIYTVRYQNLTQRVVAN